MKTEALCLILTDKCNAACDICCFSCSPENKNVMSRETMLKTIKEAKDSGNIEAIGFSGGEPFLYYDLLKEGILYAKKLGFFVNVATNGFWGAWSDEDLRDKILTLPVDSISFSYDAYHGEYVTEKAIRRALALCQSYNIECTLGIGETKEKKLNDFLHNLRFMKPFIEFYTYPFVSAGRAAEKLPYDAFYRYVELDGIKCSNFDTIAVRYDGEVFPCCSQEIFSTELSLGNINENSLDDILKNSRMSKLISCLSNTTVFSELAKYASAECGIKLPEKCSRSCEICNLMFCDKENIEKLSARADELYNKEIVRSFIGGKESGK